MRILIITALLAFLIIPTMAWSIDGGSAVVEEGVTNTAEQNKVATATPVEEGEIAMPLLTDSVLPSLTKIGLSLLLVIVVIYGTVFLMRKLSGNRLAGAGSKKSVQLIEQTYLAPKKSICLVKLADRAVLLGMTDTQINFLTEIEWDAMPQEVHKKVEAQAIGFQSILNDAAGKIFGSKKKKGTAGDR